MSSGSTLRIPIWRTADADREAVGHAAQTLTDRLGSQIEWSVAVERRGVVDLPDAPYDTYGGYLDAFRDAADLETGTVNVCLYDYWLPEALDEIASEATRLFTEEKISSCSKCGEGDTDPVEDPPFAGYDYGRLTPDDAPCALVNAGWRFPLLTDTIFENFVIHEVLHAAVDGSNAPVEGNDHSFGTVTDGTASPMLTGYTETYAANPTPAAACELDDVPEANRHTTRLSDCTREEVDRYLHEQFGDGDAGA